MAGDKYLLGVDIGTSGSRGVLVDLEGNVVTRKAVEHGIDSEKPGWYEHDADRVWWADLKTITRALLSEGKADAEAVAAVGISALGPDMLPVDQSGRPLRKGILYSDGRAQKQIDDIVDQFGVEEMFQSVGKNLSSSSIGPKILWLRENEPALYRRVHKIHSASSYLVFKLTGEVVVDYVIARGYCPLFSTRDMDWNKNACRKLGLPMDILPEARWGTDLAGHVTAEAARETGLAEGTLVITGTADACAEALGAGVVAEGEASLLYGSTTVFTLITGKREPRGRFYPLPWAIPNTYKVGFNMSASGILARWFRDNFGQVEQDVEGSLGINAYQLLGAQAAEIPPGCEGLIVLPYFAGERSPIYDVLARGLMIGLTLSHTRRHVYRALLEGAAYALRQNLEVLRATGAQVKRIIATGGGTKSRLWTQIVSDVTGRDQEIVAEPLGAAYGDAFMAGYGAGIFKDLSPLREGWAPAMTRVRHNPEAQPVYDRYYQVYCDLYESNKDHMHELAELSVGRLS